MHSARKDDTNFHSKPSPPLFHINYQLPDAILHNKMNDHGSDRETEAQNKTRSPFWKRASPNRCCQHFRRLHEPMHIGTTDR